MTLLLVGWGYAPGMQTLEALEAVHRADVVYVESYTMPGSDWLYRSVAEARVMVGWLGRLGATSRRGPVR